MLEEINQALQDKDWARASDLIKAELEKEPEDQKLLHDLLYNLIACSINLKRFRYAKNLIEKNIRLFTEAEVKGMIRELKRMPKPQIKEDKADKTRIKEGRIEALGFFDSDTTFNDVIGLNEVKEYLKKNIVYQIKYPEQYRKMGAELNGGIIFYGPPGTGKTLLARAVAHEVGGRMLVVRLPDIINKYAGDSEKNIQKVFAEAKKKKPSIVFIDEIDGIGQKRENADNDLGQGALTHNVVTTLLSEIDGISKDMQNVYVIGTTNHPWALDDALTRSGRISDKLYIPLPKLKDRIELFKYYAKKMPVSHLDYLKLGLRSFGFSPADIKATTQIIANEKAASVIEGRGSDKITTKDMLNAIKKKKKEIGTMDWYSGAIKYLSGKPKAETSQYKELIKDIKFWYMKAPAYARMQRILSLIL
jgi:SpoVK/Ycf46/Vps4 family AAA+-type ATPase